MGNAIVQMRSDVAEFLEATTSLLAPLCAELRASVTSAQAPLAWLLQRIELMLDRHTADLLEHLTRLGGSATLRADEHVTAAAPVPAAALLRKVYAKLGMLQVAALMLDTNARARGFPSTAALANRHRDEIISLVERISTLWAEQADAHQTAG
jgi:hypothetical protein